DPLSGTPSLSGNVAGDSVTLGGTGVGTLASRNAGTQAVTISGYSVSGFDSGNYVFSQPSVANVTISTKALTITADAQSSTYGETLGLLTYSSSGLAIGDGFTGALSTALGGAGTALIHTNGFDVTGSPFAITQGTLTINDGNGGNNYSVTYNPANLTLA